MKTEIPDAWGFIWILGREYNFSMVVSTFRKKNIQVAEKLTVKNSKTQVQRNSSKVSNYIMSILFEKMMH